MPCAPTSPDIAAYGEEARLLGEAIVTPASKNLSWLYQSSGRVKRPAAAQDPAKKATETMRGEP